MDVKQSLERIVKKYSIPTGLVALETPLHESMHMTLAKLLPGVGCSGVVLNNDAWYARPLSLLTLGYYKAQTLAPSLRGYAEISTQDNFIGHVSSAITSAGPEVASMTLGFYWLAKAVDHMKEKGNRMYSIFTAFCGSVFVHEGFNYATYSAFGGEEGADHLGFTSQVLQATHLPEFIAPYVTLIGAGAMVAGALRLAGYFRDRKQKKKETTVNQRYEFSR